MGRSIKKANQQFLSDRLKLSKISPEAAKYAGITALPDRFRLSYFDPSGKLNPKMWRERLANPLPGRKYLAPEGSGCQVYWPRVKGLDWSTILKNPKVPVAIVEGELKALCLCLAGVEVTAVAIGGVWNWVRNKQLLPDLARLAAGGRDILIIFDSDTEDKPQCSGARYWLAKAMLDTGGNVHIIRIPHLPDDKSPDKTGADDLVRLEELSGEKLYQRLQDLEDKQKFPMMHELFRLNAEYVLNLNTAKVHRTDDPERAWKDTDFCRVIEVGTCVAESKDGKPQIHPAAKEWIRWPQRNVVYGSIYEPCHDKTLYVYQDGKRYLNDWTGWASMPVKDAEGVRDYWTCLLDHIFRPPSGETKEQTEKRDFCRRWFEMWWAYPIQYPGAKLLSAAALLGRQGGGKGMVGTMVGWAVYGRHFQEITQRNLESNFNSLYSKNKSLVMGSEITSRELKDRREVAEYLKNVITGETLQVTQKHVDDRNLKNVINLYLTSNYGDALNLDGDDRRFFVWDVPDETLEAALGKAWLKVAWDYAKSDKGKSALHYHLLNLSIDKKIFDPNGFPPDTEAKQRAKRYSQNDTQRWVEEFAENPDDKTEQFGETVWRLQEVHAKCRADSHFRPPSQKAFEMAFTEKFRNAGRAEVEVYHNAGRWKMIKTGLWVKKSDDRLLAEIKKAWQKQAAEEKRRRGLTYRHVEVAARRELE